MKLQDFNFVIYHVGGDTNSWADALSRPEGVDKVSPKVDTVLPDQFFVRCLSGCMDNDEEEAQKTKGSKIEQYHDTPTAGHPDVKRTLDLLLRNRHQWKGIQKDVQDYVKGCLVCQKAKPVHGKQTNPLHPLPIPSALWKAISWDLISLLPESRIYNTIITIVDTRMKGIKLKPANIMISAMGTATVMRDRVFREEGLPAKVYSDHCPQFVSKFVKELYGLLRIEGNPSTAYHPQMDSQTERINGKSRSISACLPITIRLTGPTGFLLPSSCTIMWYKKQ
jgi:hypothetical protein